jgi:RNA polymerase sigma-70 factor (ECF subfamily)
MRPPDTDDLLTHRGRSDVASVHVSCLLGEFPTFFAETFPRLVLVLRRRVGDEKLAEDIAQETMVITLLQWQRVCAADKPSAYVTAIAFHLVSRLHIPERPTEDLEVPEQHASGPGLDEQTVTRMMLDQALNQLPPMQFEVIVRHYLLDQDTKSIGEDLGISRGTVGAHLFKARAKLRKLLRPLQSTYEERGGR